MEPKYLVFEKNDKYKLLTFLGVLIAFILSTLILFIIAQAKKSTIYAPIIAIVLPLLSALGANYIGKKSDEKKVANGDSWNESEEDLQKGKKSRFSKFGNHFTPNVTIFGGILSFISAYLSIYLSEVLNLTRDLQKQYLNDSFSSIFVDVVKNIFSADWSRKYLIEYWFWLTGFIVVVTVASIYGLKNLEKMRREEKEKRDKNNSKFN